MSELRGLTVREAAGVLGVSLGAAKIRLHRGRRALRDLVDRECRMFRDERNELSCEPAARGTAASYPSREVLAELAGLALPKSVYTEAVQELVAIGAAIAANCEPCFRYHFDKARKLGVSKEDMARAVTTAQTVKESPARAVLALAEKYTGSRIVTKDGRDACRPAPDGEPSSPTPGKCC
ncbi:carboxymuconolactone decarboxylase family protein [Anaeromyxobacter oryzisoli]|uniref:carboxymuconolactone decarboxylase family protein n=1 Tax=Anaeromyxobacter oryzisoli TaxID=2925408 RepID=UPI001F565350|nr:carboxymuconolactone decarboxylase family protein [Anaeromyxobacter sp. SG63]